MEENGYPTDDTLDQIENWKIDNLSDILGLIDLAQENWWPDGEYGFYLKGKRVLMLQLHTGGWSGNEEIISALQGNLMFFPLFWQKSLRGGHYYFRIPTGEFEK